jgi:23S rRNA (uracil1939-C5)-methyltransferase
MPDPIVCQFHDLSHDGMGVGKHDGKIIFADLVLPEEEALVEITETKKKFNKADVLKILKKSKWRVEPTCPYFSKCGGCQIMHLDYAKQLEQKKKRVLDQLKKTLAITPTFEIQKSPNPLHYRNKIELKLVEDQLGFYEKQSHVIVDINHCAIAKGALNEAIAFLQKEKSDLKGVYKITLRTNNKEDQLTCILHTENKIEKRFFEKFSKEVKSVVGIIVKNGKKTDLVFGRREVEETILGKKFFVDCEAFLQVNLLQAEKLYQEILSTIQPKKGDVILDAYCGIGILATLLAMHQAEVIGMDIVSQAIDSANKNKEQYQLNDLKFHVSAFENNRLSLSAVNWLILNPPRGGLDPRALKKVQHNQIPNLIYVSCDPATLARDLSVLYQLGYQVEKGELFDLFPQTMHVETLVILKKK